MYHYAILVVLLGEMSVSFFEAYSFGKTTRVLDLTRNDGGFFSLDLSWVSRWLSSIKCHVGFSEFSGSRKIVALIGMSHFDSAIQERVVAKRKEPPSQISSSASFLGSDHPRTGPSQEGVHICFRNLTVA